MKIIFEILALVLFNLLLIGKICVFNKKQPRFVSKYVAFVTFLLVLYCICAIIMILQGSFVNKLFFLFFAVSPFVIGRLISFRTLNFYTNLQLLTIILSGFYSIWFLK